MIGARAFLDKRCFHQLFGEDAYLEFGEALGLQGGFVSRQELAAASPLSRLAGIPVVGPLEGPSRVELPRSLARGLGVDPPVRHSGDVESAPRVTLIGPKGHVELDQGMISLTRTLQCSPENARRLGLMNGDTVMCALRSGRRSEVREAVRDGILAEVFVRVSDDHDLELQIDSDDANSCRVTCGDMARLLLPDGRGAEERSRGWLPVGRLVGEKELRAAKEQGLRIKVTRGMILTPTARDLGREWGLLEFESSP